MADMPRIVVAGGSGRMGQMLMKAVLENPETHQAKAERITSLWPATIVEPW